MEWYTQLSNMYALTGNAPLATDFALRGPDADRVGYGLAYGLQASPTEIELYPPEETPLGPEV